MKSQSTARTLRRGYSRAAPALLRDQAPSSDEALTALAARGDADALGELYDRYGAAAYGLALRVLGDPRSAAAVGEEVFATLRRAKWQISSSGTSARAWILGLVHRRAVERLRSSPRGTEARQAVDGQQTGGIDGRVDPERERAQRALDCLTAAEREILVLSYYEGLTASELAARLDQSLETVTATMHAGLSRVRSALAAG